MSNNTRRAKKDEMPELLKKLNEAIESVDSRLKADEEVTGIVIIRWLGKSKRHHKALTVLGKACAGCIIAVGEHLAKEEVETELFEILGSLISSGKSAKWVD